MSPKKFWCSQVIYWTLTDCSQKSSFCSKCGSMISTTKLTPFRIQAHTTWSLTFDFIRPGSKTLTSRVPSSRTWVCKHITKLIFLIILGPFFEKDTVRGSTYLVLPIATELNLMCHQSGRKGRRYWYSRWSIFVSCRSGVCLVLRCQHVGCVHDVISPNIWKVTLASLDSM